MRNKKDNKLVHNNYVLNIDKFNKAKEKGFFLEALLIIFSINEHEVSSLIVALCSLSNRNLLLAKQFLNEIKRRYIDISKKINLVKELISVTDAEVFKNEEGKKELIIVLNKILANNKNIRNKIFHDILYANLTNEEIEIAINSEYEIKRVIEKNKSRINYYKKKHSINIDPIEVIDRVY